MDFLFEFEIKEQRFELLLAQLVLGVKALFKLLLLAWRFNLALFVVI